MSNSSRLKQYAVDIQQVSLIKFGIMKLATTSNKVWEVKHKNWVFSGKFSFMLYEKLQLEI